MKEKSGDFERAFSNGLIVGKHVWEGSLVESMDGVTLVSHDSMSTDPVVQDLRSELDAAWEEHAAKRSRKTSPEKPQGKSKLTGHSLPLFFTNSCLREVVLKLEEAEELASRRHKVV